MKTYGVANPPIHDPEIKPLQEALHEAKLYMGPLDSTFGVGTGHGCWMAKYRLGYPIKEVRPTGGQQLLNFLRGTDKLPPTYILRRHKRGYGISKIELQRKKFVEYCNWAVTHESSIYYRQRRPMQHMNDLHYLPEHEDCSEFYTKACKYAGMPDPNHFNYGGWGNTSTLKDHGITIPLYHALPGDAVIWGSGYGHHVAGVYEIDNRNDPLLCSHGGNRGPVLVRHSVETRLQQRGYVVKRYLKD